MQPAAVLEPVSAADLADALAAAARDGQSVTPWGGGTQQRLGKPPERYDVALRTTRLDRVLQYAPNDMTVRVEGGITLGELLRRGYDKALSMGSLAGAGTLGFLMNQGQRFLDARGVDVNAKAARAIFPGGGHHDAPIARTQINQIVATNDARHLQHFIHDILRRGHVGHARLLRVHGRGKRHQPRQKPSRENPHPHHVCHPHQQPHTNPIPAKPC